MTAEKPDIWAVYEALGGETQQTKASGWQKAKAICHEDKNPSTTINGDEGKLHCWSCGYIEDAYGLIMRLEGLDFAQAKQRAEELAPGGLREVRGKPDAAGPRVPGRSRDQRDRRAYAPSWRSR